MGCLPERQSEFIVMFGLVVGWFNIVIIIIICSLVR